MIGPFSSLEKFASQPSNSTTTSETDTTTTDMNTTTITQGGK